MSLQRSSKLQSDNLLLNNMPDKPQRRMSQVKSLTNSANANANANVNANAIGEANVRAYRSLDIELDRQLKRHSENSPQLKRHSENLLKLKQMMSSSKITAFLQRQLVRKNFDLSKRLQFYAYIQKHMASLKTNNCLQRETVKTFRYENMDVYNIGDVIYLMRPIGSDSVFGIVYRADVKQTLGNAPIAAKIMAATKRNKKEIDINARVSKCVLQQITPHFVLYYKSFQCIQNKMQLPSDADRLIGEHKSMANFLTANYFITLTERVDSDLRTLFNDRSVLANINAVKNIACQCMLCVMTLHRLGYAHQDCHWGNFLYHKTDKKDGYYHYIIDGVDYFLEDYGYTIMIYDFGKAINADRLKVPDLLRDYTKILNAFSNKTHFGWVKYADLPDHVISMRMKQFRTKLKERASRYANEEMLIRDILKYFQNHMLRRDALKADAKILNSVPYRIDSSITAI